jgi:hypothetical protein
MQVKEEVQARTINLGVTVSCSWIRSPKQGKRTQKRANNRALWPSSTQISILRREGLNSLWVMQTMWRRVSRTLSNGIERNGNYQRSLNGVSFHKTFSQIHMSKTSVYLCICVFMYLASKFIFLPP